jgi:DNA-binding GntR family transcriptional regulator
MPVHVGDGDEVAGVAALRGGEPEDAGRARGSGQSLSDQIAEQIKDALVQGHLLPGSRLSADGLARQYQVSHIPVREALNRLQVEGHLIAIPNRGFFVPDLSLADVEDIYLWRQVLEDHAHRMGVPLLTGADLAQMDDLCLRMRKASSENDPLRFHRINRQFHFVPFLRTGSQRLVRLLDPLWDAASHYQSVLIREDRSLPRLQEQHEELLDAFRARDVDKVLAVGAEHREVTLAMMREVLR